MDVDAHSAAAARYDQGVRIARYALAALAVLKAITLGIGVEQGAYPARAIAAEAALVAVAGLAAWRVGYAPRRWIAVGALAYVLEIAAFAWSDPQSLIQGFFLKAGVLFALGAAWGRVRRPG